MTGPSRGCPPGAGSAISPASLRYSPEYRPHAPVHRWRSLRKPRARGTVAPPVQGIYALTPAAPQCRSPTRWPARSRSPEELGVEISLPDETLELVTGGWDELEPSDSLTDLNARLSKDQVTIGDIAYPEVACRPEDNGGARSLRKDAGRELFFAQAVLAPGVPYQLLDFPRMIQASRTTQPGTGWAKHGQFDSYQTLGHFIGRIAARRSKPLDDGIGAARPSVPDVRAAPSVPG